MKALALLLAPLVLLLSALLGVVVVLGTDDVVPSEGFASCSPELPGSTSGVNLSREQWTSARAIVAAGQAREVPPRGWVIAVATALQESTLRPLPYGDRDSLGLFQQRRAWGTATARIDPGQAAAMFYTGGRGGQPGLLDVSGWIALPLTEAAQAVQRSAFPDAYARWEPLAERIVATLADVRTDCGGPGTWTTPIRPGTARVSAAFGQCGPLWSACHTGLDLAAPTGTPVMAAGSGTVVFSGTAGPYGNVVRVLHADGVATWYAHLDRRLVPSGMRVRAGDVVGLVGSTGNTTGPHLHFEVRQSATATSPGTATDPAPWLRRQVALPTSQ